ncbi:hypothetical protein L1987_64451 [Smallanthus sonchifolius]|uniref:Uncharacterized protein n=1 Tax=Smallanthus sonchifolius TaxID=185202 RepID=A0ACB9CG05_9ASTR|nr:hypothetical protein L1987_64451 [Smallanthus sonchifolius]
MSSSIDYKGADFELTPFGSGRRGCPGMSFGSATVELALSNLLYSFHWELPEGTKDIDTLKAEGVVMHKKNALLLVAKVPDNLWLQDFTTPQRGQVKTLEIKHSKRSIRHPIIIPLYMLMINYVVCI